MIMLTVPQLLVSEEEYWRSGKYKVRYRANNGELRPFRHVGTSEESPSLHVGQFRIYLDDSHTSVIVDQSTICIAISEHKEVS